MRSSKYIDWNLGSFQYLLNKCYSLQRYYYQKSNIYSFDIPFRKGVRSYLGVFCNSCHIVMNLQRHVKKNIVFLR